MCKLLRRKRRNRIISFSTTTTNVMIIYSILLDRVEKVGSSFGPISIVSIKLKAIAIARAHIRNVRARSNLCSFFSKLRP